MINTWLGYNCDSSRRKVFPMDIREATIDDYDAIGLVTVTTSHSVFIGAIPEEDLDFSRTPEVSAANWRAGFSQNTDRGQHFLVAEEDHRVVGFVWCSPWADTRGIDASVRGLYVYPTHQRRGVDKVLLKHGVTRLRDAGLRSLEIGCLKENRSCGFYRHMGGVEIGRSQVRVDRYDTEEILFGWRNLSTLGHLGFG